MDKVYLKNYIGQIYLQITEYKLCEKFSSKVVTSISN